MTKRNEMEEIADAVLTPARDGANPLPGKVAEYARPLILALGDVNKPALAVEAVRLFPARYKTKTAARKASVGTLRLELAVLVVGLCLGTAKLPEGVLPELFPLDEAHRWGLAWVKSHAKATHDMAQLAKNGNNRRTRRMAQSKLRKMKRRARHIGMRD